MKFEVRDPKFRISYFRWPPFYLSLRKIFPDRTLKSGTVCLIVICMAKDIIHDAVRNALVKDGWTVTDEPFRIVYEEFELFADLAVGRAPVIAEKYGRKIVVGVKTFGGRSFVKDFQHALGQYIMYRDLMELTCPGYELCLGISEFVHEEFFSQKAAMTIVRRHKLRFVIVDIGKEEIVKWTE